MQASTKELEAWLVKKSVLAGVSLQTILREQAPLLAKDIASLTAPMAGYHPGKMTAADKKAGTMAIYFDLVGRRTGEGIVHVAPQGVIEHYRKIYGDFRPREINKGWERSRTVAEAKELYDARGTKLKKYHEKNRSRATGQISKANAQRVIGQWKIVDKLWVTKRALNRHMRLKGKKVGEARHGWYATIRGFEGRGWPVWVKKAVGQGATGSRIDGSKQPRDPFITLVNQVKHVGNNPDMRNNAVNRGLRIRRKKIARALQYKMNKVWKK